MPPLGLLALDLAGSIVMISTRGDPPASVVGAMVAVDVPALGIYPTGIWRRGPTATTTRAARARRRRSRTQEE